MPGCPAPRACLLLSLAACSSAGEARGEPPAAPAEPAVRVEAEPDDGRTDDGSEYFFAVLGQSGVEHCEDDYGVEPTWLAIEPTLGFVRAGGPGLTNIDASLYDQPVLARGRTREPPPSPPIEVEPALCGMMQMRSDWVSTPRGIRVMRETDRSRLPDYFHASSVRRLDELELRREGDEIVVTLANPLSVGLTRVQFEMHYEGCYGKPGTTSRNSAKTRIEPGARASHRFATIVQASHVGPRKGGPSARDHRASQLVVRVGEANGLVVHSDLALSLRDVGVEVECP